jgi:hypothetical protein
MPTIVDLFRWLGAGNRFLDALCFQLPLFLKGGWELQPSLQMRF